jgi:hypothetical protein
MFALKIIRAALAKYSCHRQYITPIIATVPPTVPDTVMAILLTRQQGPPFNASAVLVSNKPVKQQPIIQKLPESSHKNTLSSSSHCNVRLYDCVA